MLNTQENAAGLTEEIPSISPELPWSSLFPPCVAIRQCLGWPHHAPGCADGGQADRRQTRLSALCSKNGRVSRQGDQGQPTDLLISVPDVLKFPLSASLVDSAPVLVRGKGETFVGPIPTLVLAELLQTCSGPECAGRISSSSTDGRPKSVRRLGARSWIPWGFKVGSWRSVVEVKVL